MFLILNDRHRWYKDVYHASDLDRYEGYADRPLHRSGLNLRTPAIYPYSERLFKAGVRFALLLPN